MTQTRAEQIAFHKAEIAKLETVGGRVKPDVGQTYYTVNELGDVGPYRWSGDRFDVHSYNTNSAHLIEAEALAAHDERVARVADQDAADAAWAEHSTVLDWGDGTQKKWSMSWCHQQNGWVIMKAYDIQDQGVCYFPTYQSALASVEGKGAPV